MSTGVKAAALRASAIWIEIVAVTCIAGLPGCAVDRGTTGGASDAGLGVPLGRSVRVLDSSTVLYDLPSFVVDSGFSVLARDAGACAHLDVSGNPDCSSTLTLNSDFNHTIAGWGPVGGALLRWISFDSQSSDNSGSIAVKNAEQGDYDGSVGVAAAQCFPAAPNAAYELSASMFTRSGQTSGLGQLVVFVYDGRSCTGKVTDAIATVQVDTTDTWDRGGGTVPTRRSTQSVSVQLTVQKPFRAGALEVAFDAVRVHQVQAGDVAERDAR